MIFKYKSRIGKADTKGVSSRTIVPSAIIKMLELNFGDDMVWIANITTKGVTVTVESAKKDEQNIEKHEKKNIRM